jgi:hypothetical protein
VLVAGLIVLANLALAQIPDTLVGLTPFVPGQGIPMPLQYNPVIEHGVWAMLLSTILPQVLGWLLRNSVKAVRFWVCQVASFILAVVVNLSMITGALNGHYSVGAVFTAIGVAFLLSWGTREAIYQKLKAVWDAKKAGLA